MAIEFLKSLEFILREPARYKVVWGGRGAGKSEGIATALIVLASAKRLRIACFREFQKSIKESVHSLIKQKIFDMGLEAEFNITDVTITSLRTGSEFIFSGLRYNIDSIKSMARIDIAWVEEANNVSATSWKKLGPTIRGRHESDPNGMGGPFGEGPEIIVSFNPEMAEDETYKRFILKPPHEFDNRGKRFIITKKINWQDNPWFPDDLRSEMEECRARSEDEYLEVWEGHTKQVLDGAIYAEEIRKVIKENRLGKVPYDSSRPVHTFWDLGRNDHTSIWFIQTVGMEFNVIDYYENRLKKMPWYIGVLQEKKYVYGVHNLPHDGSAETLSNITPEKQLRNMQMGKVRIIQRPVRKFVGINAVRTVLDVCNFDEENTADGFNCLRRYCYEVDEATGGFSKEPKHDEYSNGADGFQTFALSLKSEIAGKKKDKVVAAGQITPIRSENSWMGM